MLVNILYFKNFTINRRYFLFLLVVDYSYLHVEKKKFAIAVIIMQQQSSNDRSQWLLADPCTVNFASPRVV